MKKMIMLIILCATVGFAFGATNGVVGDKVVGWLQTVLGFSPEFALEIYTAIVVVLVIIVRIVLKKMPSSTETIFGRVIWKFLSGIFGDGVMIENNTNPEFIKEQLIKKHPFLKIEVKK